MVLGIRGNVHQSYNSFSAAKAAYNAEFDAGTVRVVRNPGDPECTFGPVEEAMAGRY